MHAFTLLFTAPEVPAKSVWVAPGAAARSLGHGRPWGQISIVAWLLHLEQLKGSCSSLLLSSEVLPDGNQAGRVCLGQLETSQVQFQRAWPVIMVF